MAGPDRPLAPGRGGAHAVHTVIVTHSHPDHRATATAGRATVEAVTQQVFHPRAWGHMAESETYAHLEHLRHQGRVAVDDRGSGPRI